MAICKWDIEYTDTFGGEANYSWVRRATIETEENTPNREVARRAKAEMGLTGVRGTAYWHGDHYEFRPYGSCTVMFITFQY